VLAQPKQATTLGIFAYPKGEQAEPLYNSCATKQTACAHDCNISTWVCRSSCLCDMSQQTKLRGNLASKPHTFRDEPRLH